MTHQTQLADPEALLTEAQAAEMVGFTPRALQAWRGRGCGPRFIRISSRAVRYRRRDLIAWIDAHAHGSPLQSDE